MLKQSSAFPLAVILQSQAQATANISGSPQYPSISGVVRFYQTQKGVILYAEIRGLPKGEGPCHNRFFGFHIHKGNACSGNENDPFADALSHYDTGGCPHPHHAGDLPPLLGNDGFALCAFLTNRFSIHEIIGKTIIIHDQPDDFTTQPSGNSGTKIACGVIRWCAVPYGPPPQNAKQL